MDGATARVVRVRRGGIAGAGIASGLAAQQRALSASGAAASQVSASLQGWRPRRAASVVSRIEQSLGVAPLTVAATTPARCRCHDDRRSSSSPAAHRRRRREHHSSRADGAEAALEAVVALTDDATHDSADDGSGGGVKPLPGARCIELILIAMVVHEHDALVQLFGAQALHALLVASASLGHDAGRAAEKSAARVGSRGGDPARDRTRAMLREHGEPVAEALLRLAHNFPAVPSALWPAAVTLHALVVECLPALARVARADGARALVKAMAACIDAPPAQEQLMRLLEECATRDFVARGALCDAGALNVVRKAMFVHKGHGGLRLFAGRAYAALGAGALGDVGSEENFGGSKDGADADY